MFNFTRNKMENKFINILNAGWVGNELYTTMKGQRAWQFTSEDNRNIVTASYDKRTGLISTINGGEISLLRFITETEEADAAQALVRLMFLRRYYNNAPQS